MPINYLQKWSVQREENILQAPLGQFAFDLGLTTRRIGIARLNFSIIEL
jgi:hypothetical protein